MISVNGLYFSSYAIVSFAMLHWVNANVGYWENIFNLRNGEGQGNGEIPTELEQLTLPHQEFVVDDRIICKEDPADIRTEFNSALTFTKLRIRIILNLERTLDAGQNTAEPVNDDEIMRRLKQYVREELENYQARHLLGTFCENIWQLCSDTIDTADTTSPGSIVTETITVSENITTEMPMVECNVDRNPPFQFFAFTLSDHRYNERLIAEDLLEVVFLLKRDDTNNVQLFAYTLRPNMSPSLK